MRNLWSGSLSFGLINIPVQLVSATQDSTLDLDLLHRGDLCPIHFARVCSHDGKEVPYDQIVRGYEYKKGDYVILEDEDFKRASAKKTQSIEILSFTTEDEIDTVFFEKPYYLKPDKKAEKAYVLLRDSLKESGKVGIARFVLRNREHLAVIKIHEDALVLNQIRFNEEVKEVDPLKIPKQVTVTDKEKDMALALIEHLTEKFDAKKYKDTYTAQLMEVIEEKAHGKEPEVHDEAPEPTRVDDLMQLLKASLSKKKTPALHGA